MTSGLSRRGIYFKPKVWCSREELNLHGFPHTVLSRTRLPFRHVSVAKMRPLNCLSRRRAQAVSSAAPSFPRAFLEGVSLARFA